MPANSQQTTLNVRPNERVGDVLDRIRRDATSEAEKGRWFEHLFMATVRDNAELDVAGIWPWREWAGAGAHNGRARLGTAPAANC